MNNNSQDSNKPHPQNFAIANNMAAQAPAANRWLIIFTIMSVAMLEVLDSTIVNIALPAMMSALNVNAEQISWVVTSYVVASAITLPMTGFLSNYFGKKNLLLICVAGFMLTSMLAGISHSFTQMVIIRILQGAFGSPLMPLSQTILRDSFPPAELGKAMAIWGLGIMMAPIMGPTIGGYITENMNWRWIFYVNIPICLIGFLLTMSVIPASPRRRTPIDYQGLLLMMLGVGSLQLFLDQGNQRNWFDSSIILLFALLSIIALSLFVIHSWRHPDPLVRIKIYKNRTFTLCSVILALACGLLFGTMVLQPIMLETLFNYSSITAGIVMAPRGIISGVFMILTIVLMKRIPLHWLLTASLLLCAAGTWGMSQLNLQADFFANTWPGLLQGAGMGLLMVPLSSYSLQSLSKRDLEAGAGLFSYARMLGVSVGISLLSTLVSRLNQINWSRFSDVLTPFNPNLPNWLHAHHFHSLTAPALGQLSQEMARQASMMTYIDTYYLVSWLFLLLIPLVFFIKPIPLNSNETIGGH